MTVTTAGAAPRTRYFVAADIEKVTLLNVSDPALSFELVKLLRHAAIEHPGWFTGSPSPGATLILDKQVVLRLSGLFVADQKIADYNQIVEEVTRADVENGVVLIGKAGKHLETSTKTLLAVVIPVTAFWLLTLIMRHLSR